jgi:cytochrome c553
VKALKGDNMACTSSASSVRLGGAIHQTGKQRLRVALAAALTLAAASASVQAQQVSPPGRLLASNCFQCHGTNGKGPGFERLAGDSANSIYNDLKKYQSRGNGSLMGAHSLGYTDAQLRDLANWLSTQR